MNLRFEPVWIVGEGQLSLKLLTGFSFHSCGKTKLRVIQRNDITLLIIQSQSHTPNFSAAQISNTSSLILPVTSKPGCINRNSRQLPEQNGFRTLFVAPPKLINNSQDTSRIWVIKSNFFFFLFLCAGSNFACS